MTSASYLFLFNSQKPLIVERSKVWDYVPKELTTNLSFLTSFLTNKYILCAIYADNHLNPTVYDFQLGITGKAKVNESEIEAIKREITEEAPYLDFTSINYLTKLQNYNIYTLPLTINPTHISIKKSGNDDKNKRVMCLIYGDLPDFEEYFRFLQGSKQKPDDNIVGYLVIPTEMIDYLITNKTPLIKL
jgi:hypothetical protein